MKWKLPQLALRVISCARNDQVAFGEKLDIELAGKADRFGRE
jgi:hypothetical protein